MVRGFQEKLGIIIVNVFGSNGGMSFITGEGDMPDPDKRASLFPRRGTYRRPYGEGRAPNIESRLVPPGGGDPIEADGVPGELQIRGPTLFERYHNAPDQTAKAFTDDHRIYGDRPFRHHQAGRKLARGRGRDDCAGREVAAVAKVASGEIAVALAGGVEPMSSAPFLGDRAGYYTNDELPPHARFVPPVLAADRLANSEGITRAELDAVALASQRKAAAAETDPALQASRIATGALIGEEGIRPQTSADLLAAAKR